MKDHKKLDIKVKCQKNYCCQMIVLKDVFGTSLENIKRLQVMQNNAARLILQKSRRHEATPLLYQLHWLPVQERIKYKAASMVYKCLDGSAPEYLQQLLTVYTPARSLRSSNAHQRLKIPKTRLKAGQRTLSHFGATTWNNLPTNVKMSSSSPIFKRNLKTHLFRTYYNV